MSERMKSGVLVVALSCAGLCAPGCTGDNAPGDEGQSWEALMSDGDPAQMAPGAMRPMPPPPPGAVGRSVLSERRLQRLAAGAVDVRRLQRIEHRARRHGVHVPAPPRVPLGQRRLRARDRGRRGEARRRRGHHLLARSAGLRVRSGADRGRLDQPRSHHRHAEHRAQALRRDQLVRAGDRREEAGVRAEAHQRQDRRCLRGRAGRRPVHAHRRHVRRQGRDPLRRRRRGREDARGGQDRAGRRTDLHRQRRQQAAAQGRR